MRFFVDGEKSRQYALSHAFLRLVLAQAFFPQEHSESLIESAKQLRFSEAEFGKPIMENVQQRACSFSLSRSNRAAAVCFGWNTSVGVDVESLEQKKHMTPALLDYAFSENERRTLANHDSPEEDALRLWTRKEAILKADGSGLGIAPSAVETLLTSDQPIGLPPGLGGLSDWGVYTRSSGTQVVSVAVRR